MKKFIRVTEIKFIIGLMLTGVLCAAFADKDPGQGKGLKAVAKVAPLVAQKLNFTENPIDIPNPDRGFYRPGSFVLPVEAGSIRLNQDKGN